MKFCKLTSNNFLFFSFLILVLVPIQLKAGIDLTSSLDCNIRTPNAAHFGSFGEVPVSLYTGTPQISIPIYATTHYGVGLNLSLDYDSKGVRPNILPGWTGHNWSLMVGGVITRVQHGYVDEFSYDVTPYFQCYNKVDFRPSFKTRETRYDLQPDEFVFNFMGKHGHFFMGNDGQWKVCCDENIAVYFDVDKKENFVGPFSGSELAGNNPAQYRVIRGFLLVDENGTRYYFGSYLRDSCSCDPIEYSIKLSGYDRPNKDNQAWEANSWYLASVRDINDNELYSFEYQRGPFITQELFDFRWSNREYQVTVMDTIHEKLKTNEEFIKTIDHTYQDCEVTINTKDYPYISTLCSPIYLNKIKTTDGTTINFFIEKAFATDTTSYPKLNLNKNHYYYSAAQKYLTDAKFKNYWFNKDNSTSFISHTGLMCLRYITINHGENQDVIELVYNNKEPLMHLISVIEGATKSFDHQSPVMQRIKGKYTLLYNDWTKIHKDYLSLYTDHWGYYNGKLAKIEDLFPLNDSNWRCKNENAFWTSKNVNPDMLQLGMLNTIIYPTGGCTTFEFESNQFQRVLRDDHTGLLEQSGFGGGLRISQITNYNDSSRQVVTKQTKYTYEDGEIEGIPDYTRSFYPEFENLGQPAYVHINCINSSSVIPLANQFGVVIGYGQVTETNSDGTKVIYTYSNYNNRLVGFDDKVQSQYCMPSSRDYGRGKLISVVKKVNDNVIYQLVHTYRNDEKFEQHFVRANNYLYFDSPIQEYVNYNNYNYSNHYYYLLGNEYKLFYGKFDIVKTIEKITIDKDTITNITKYFKKDTILTSNVEGGRSKNKQLIRFTRSQTRSFNVDNHSLFNTPSIREEYRYTFDESKSASTFVNNHLIVPIEFTSYCNDVWCGKEKKSYKLIEKQGRKMITPSCYSKFDSNNKEIVMTQYLDYNQFGLPTKIRHRKDSLITLIDWHNDLPHAIVTSGDSTINIELNQSGTTPVDMITVKGKKVYTQSNISAKVINYCNNDKVSSITNELGFTNYYLYDSCDGRLISILDNKRNKVQNFSYHLQENGTNYVIASTFLNEQGTDSITTVQFYDGLGRKNVSATNGNNTRGLFQYNRTDMDLLGRPSRIWQPVIGSTDLDFRLLSSSANLFDNLSLEYNNYEHKSNIHKLDISSSIIYTNSNGVTKTCDNSGELVLDPLDKDCKLTPVVTVKIDGIDMSEYYVPRRLVGIYYSSENDLNHQEYKELSCDSETIYPMRDGIVGFGIYWWVYKITINGKDYDYTIGCVCNGEEYLQIKGAWPNYNLYLDEFKDGNLSLQWTYNAPYNPDEDEYGYTQIDLRFAKKVEQDIYIVHNFIKQFVGTVCYVRGTSYYYEPGANYVCNVPDEIELACISDLSQTCYQDAFGFETREYDAWDRVVKIIRPGEKWYKNEKSISISYGINEINEVKKYSCSNSEDVLPFTYYSLGDLSKTTTVDENGTTVSIYKDFRDIVILERKLNGKDKIDTYYVYDDRGLLRFVLSPMYQQIESLKKYAYQYTYDSLDRIKTKTIPGCEPIQYWYDEADRIIEMQDSLLRAKGKYRVYTYDGLGRMKKQSISNGKVVEYDEIENFYDNYEYLSQKPYSDMIPVNNEDTTSLCPLHPKNGHGQLTGTWQRASNGENMLMSYNYDDYGRLCMTKEIGLDKHLAAMGYAYNFVGDLYYDAGDLYRYDKSVGALNDNSLFAWTMHYFHDGNNKLPYRSVIHLKHKGSAHQTNDEFSRLTYDDFGRIIRNDRKGTAGDMSYEYDNLHGWLTSIKSASGFEQKLYRETGADHCRYNGSISAMSWRVDNSILRKFNYTYDNMNRLTGAGYSHYSIKRNSDKTETLTLIPDDDKSVENYSERYSYDRNSNITRILRWGYCFDESGDEMYDTADDIDLVYDGNQRRTVSNGGFSSDYYSSMHCYDTYNDEEPEYAYDGNGNLTRDDNKGLTFEYDLLGHLLAVNGKDCRIDYVYAADGRKLRTVHTKFTSSTKKTVRSRKRTDYINNYIFEDDKPVMYLFPGGYYSFDSEGNMDGCHFYVQDYQGNNRMVVNAESSRKEQVNHYYAYGSLIGDISIKPDEQNYKYSGKELDRTYGLDLYDFHARQYDPIGPGFTSIDPLAEKYYSISPYAYCAGDPINLIDPTGCEFIYDQLSEEQRKIYFDCVNTMRSYSKLFDQLYTKMEQSDQKITIVFGKTDVEGGRQVRAQYQPGEENTGTITINESLEQIKGSDLGEEVFHAFQNDNKKQYGGSCNVEFEAKTFTTAVGLECGGMQDVIGMTNFQKKIRIGEYSDDKDIIVANDKFLSEYQKYANIYSNTNRHYNIGNRNYRITTSVKPYSLLSILNKK